MKGLVIKMQEQNNMYDISEIPLESLKKLKANIEQQQKQLSVDIELVEKEIDRKKDTKMEENNKPKVIISDFYVNWGWGMTRAVPFCFHKDSTGRRAMSGRCSYHSVYSFPYNHR